MRNKIQNDYLEAMHCGGGALCLYKRTVRTKTKVTPTCSVVRARDKENQRTDILFQPPAEKQDKENGIYTARRNQAFLYHWAETCYSSLEILFL